MDALPTGPLEGRVMIATELALETSLVTRDFECRVCGGDLDVSRPDAQNPDRLFGVCVAATCAVWHYGEVKWRGNVRSVQWRLIEPTLSRIHAAV